jgi:hypothetical protein
MAKTIAAYGGGFKPPTRGHFEIVKNALQEFPEIDEFIIYVGGKERDGIDQAEAILIWEIYENYLPNKVQIKAAQSPIGDILRLAKDNPQDEIYFVIGYREGRDDDMKDVASRTSNLEEKYPNIEVKVMPTFDANMSGTNARKAINDEEDFIKFLPFEVKEKSQIWNIVRPVGAEALNENATYSQNIDYMQMISDLTNHMLEQGRNIEPLPQLVIKDGDSENAKDFFGRTAYYDPNTQTIVLYTEGRHPKDIVRSYAHEMVHHTQNLEGRIGNIQTTDTTADKKLDAIEREAYLKGNMMFRNWTDSIDGDVSSSITEGKYDSLVTKLAGFTLNAWKGDFEDGQKEGYFELEVGPGSEFDYPHLKFLYRAKARFGGFYKSTGSANPDPIKGLPKVTLKYFLDIDELPRMWEQIAFDLRNTIRHEVEHLMQSGPNVKKGKEKASDLSRRRELMTGKKPWWKIWRDKLKDAEYYKLEKEVDANLQGLYLKAKKIRKPLAQVIDNYLKFDLNIPLEDQEGIKALWRERAPKINVPVFEGRKPKKDPKKGTGKKPEGSKRRLYTDEDPKDTVGIKFSTRQDIVDTLNKKSFKAKSHARQSQIINLIHQRVRAAYGRAKDPAVKKRLKTGLDYITKRKEASKKKTQRLKKLKESKPISIWKNRVTVAGPVPPEFLEGKVLTYRGYKEQRDFPVEVVEVKWNEERNEYEYTLRLLRDLSSQRKRGLLYKFLSAEEIKRRLADKQLTRAEFERQATRRKDSFDKPITYKSVGHFEENDKDYFGLNKLIREIVEEPKYKIFSDMDGVLTDFEGRFEKYSDGMKPADYEKKFGKDKFWELVDGEGVAFWVGMPWMSDGERYWDYIKDYDTQLLSSPSRSNTSRLGKRLWVRNNMPGVKLTLAQAYLKKNYAAPNHILIDDRKSNIDEWRAEGGIGILHTSAADTIAQLKKLGL